MTPGQMERANALARIRMRRYRQRLKEAREQHGSDSVDRERKERARSYHRARRAKMTPDEKARANAKAATRRAKMTPDEKARANAKAAICMRRLRQRLKEARRCKQRLPGSGGRAVRELNSEPQAGDSHAETRAEVATDTPPPRRVSARHRRQQQQEQRKTTGHPTDGEMTNGEMATANRRLAKRLLAEAEKLGLAEGKGKGALLCTGRYSADGQIDEKKRGIAQEIGMRMREIFIDPELDSVLNTAPFAGYRDYAITVDDHDSDVQFGSTRRFVASQLKGALYTEFPGLSEVIDSATNYASEQTKKQTGNPNAFSFLVECHLLYQSLESRAGSSFKPHQDDDIQGSHNPGDHKPGYTLIIALYVGSKTPPFGFGRTPRTGVHVFGENEAAEYETHGDFVFFPSMMWHESTQPPITESGAYEAVKLALFFSAPRRTAQARE